MKRITDISSSTTLLCLCRRVLPVVVAVLSVMPLSAQTDTIRYVKTTGTYQGSGLSWAQAKNNIQDAINDLYKYLTDNNLTSGSVYVAAGTYIPTESTESFGGGLQYTSFKIFPGVHVYGGFRPDETDMNAKPYADDGKIDTLYRPLVDNLPNLESGQEAKLQPWNFRYKTVLSGSHISDPIFTFNASKGVYNTIFPTNSYHVVWFATEGFIPVTVAGDEENHALPLPNPASVDGCVITGGYASDKTITARLHPGFGGGAYMVPNSALRCCLIYNCEAAMRGGGVYMDGGGEVDMCMIHTCQSQGIGIMQGYGGGVCIDYEGALTRSYIVNNAARLGGGVAICHAPSEYPWESLDNWRAAEGQERRGEINVYSPHATACIITNNTATAEAGAIYFNDGGVGNHLTIGRNNCVGADITYNGRRHGRSGAVYILNGGHIYNSVIWGNKCPANSDIQFATYNVGSTDDVVDSEGNITKEGLRPKLYYSAVEMHDITDWSGTEKKNVMSLESTNTNESGNYANYPYFIGHDGKGSVMGHVGAGMSTSLPMGTIDQDYADGLVDKPDPAKVGIPRPIYWKPAAISSMSKMGLQVTDALHVHSQWIMHAHTATDMLGDFFEPMSTFGALVRRSEQFGAAFIKNQEIQLYREKGYTQDKLNDYNNQVVADADSKLILLGTHLPDDGTETLLPTLFVDPARNAGQKDIKIGEQGIGASWDKPVGSINDAIYYFRGCMKRVGSDGTFVYDGTSPVYYDENGDARYLINGTEYKHVQILVKGYERGSGINATTAGIGAYLGSQLRTAALRPCSNMRIYGGYYPDETGTQTDNRNPREYPTSVSADITQSGYENNSAHVVALSNVRNVIIDGLRMHDGNANLYGEHSYAPNGEPIAFGGGLILNNATAPDTERIDMTGNYLRNSYIVNCSAPNGAAVYVNSANKKADGTYCAAELNIINTIIRNNTVGTGTDTIKVPGIGNAGVITARGGKAKVRIDHSDIVNNTGYAIETLEYTDEINPEIDENSINANEGVVRIYNSVIYANGKIDRTNRSKIEYPLSCRTASGSGNNIDGEYIMLDWDVPIYKVPAKHCNLIFCRDFSDQYGKWGIRLLDEYQQTVYIDGLSPMFFDTEVEANDFREAHPAPTGTKWNNALGTDVEGAVYLDYPYFDNPSRNVGHSTDGDKPMNGGLISYIPGNQNPMVNAACDMSIRVWDINGNERSRGGDPDLGAIENHYLPKKYTVFYVTPEGAGNYSGSSWGNAIAGNYIYQVAKAPDEQPWNVDNNGEKVPTTDIRYEGGRYNPANYPFGENSNSSLDFFADGSGNTRGNGAAGNQVISNNRQEDYVSGLQYAVEKAAAYNTLADDSPQRDAEIDSVQVWVGNGVYTDHKGYVIRNKTTVLGGFPASTIGTPGMSERIALIAEGIPRPEAYKDKKAEDYETILQISRTSPLGESQVSATTASTIIKLPAGYTIHNNEIYIIQSTANAAGNNKVGYCMYAGGDDVLSGMSSQPDMNDMWLRLDYNDTYFLLYNLGTGKVISYANNNASLIDLPANPQNQNCVLRLDGNVRICRGNNYANADQALCIPTSNDNSITTNQQNNRTQWAFKSVGTVTANGGNSYTFNIEATKITATAGTIFNSVKVFRGSQENIVRKPVLAQPDVCLPTWSPNNSTGNNDNTSNTYRYEGGKNALVDANYQGYERVCWDGFTIRHGFYNQYNGNRDGGAGVRLFRGIDLMNCVIRDNYNLGGGRARGGGIYMDGDNSRVIGCFVINNKTDGSGDRYGGGGYLIIGTAYNSLFSNNQCTNNGNDGSGVFLEGALFYNNTIVYNRGTGVSHWSDNAGRDTYMEMYNTIVWGNQNNDITSTTAGALQAGNFKNNYIQKNAVGDNKIQAAYNNILGNAAAANPFAAGNNALANYDFRLAKTSVCINSGVEPLVNYNATKIVELPPYDVAFTDRVKDCQVDIGAYEYDGTKEIKPGFELIAFDPEQPDERELCAVYYVAQSGLGLGTAESPVNAACPLKLQKVLDAAARFKLDVELIKAGRAEGRTYSDPAVQVTGNVNATYEVITGTDANRAVAQQTQQVNISEVKHVVVKLSEGEYYPLRSTNDKMVQGYSEEVLPTRSIMIPHGVELWGGYDYTRKTELNSNPIFYETYRDPLNHKSMLSGDVVNKNSGEIGQAYHVISFTNNLYATNDYLEYEDSLQWLTDRAVVDGVSIENGYAFGTDEIDRFGGAAVVESYAHIRNSIIQNNSSSKCGGGLYLLPQSLVSGCVLAGNTSDLGGAVYVAELESSIADETLRNLAYSRIYNSTFVGNTALVRGGGVWYETNLRAKGVVLWHNTSNDMNNVAGVFDTGLELSENNYPFAYSAVQSRRLPGVNNIELSAENQRGPRWTQNSIDDMRWRGDPLYYTGQTNDEAYFYIERLSALVRTGMPYDLYTSLRQTYPSLELRDMAGVARMRELYDATDNGTMNYLKHMTFTPEKKDNDFIEIGARVYNYEIRPDLSHPFTRIYVANPENVDISVAAEMAESGDPLYSQQGASMAFPFQRLSDALDYIIALRSSNIETPNHQLLREVYRDTHFEVFLAGGNYYPTHNSRGQEGHGRASTFLLPEGVSVIGGLDPKVYYGQEGYYFDQLQPLAGVDILNNAHYNNDRSDIQDAGGNTVATTVELVPALTDTIWNRRPHTDINGNNIFEPWEFLYTTTLSGETMRGVGNEDNVYHVVTCYADSNYVGALPHRFSTETPVKGNYLDARSGGTESVYSQLLRMIIFNGVNITNGNARDLEEDAIANTTMFYRGGGMLVDGSLENANLCSGQMLTTNNDTVFIPEFDPPDPEAKGLRDIPVIISASQFINNNAIQGGGIFTNGTLIILSSSFVQNYSEGAAQKENAEAASDIVKFSCGGAVATNGVLSVVNTIFANNEAMFGDYGKSLSPSAPGYLQQGFGGAIWGGKYSDVGLMNCDVVNNKAVSYPGVYVNHRIDAQKFAANTIFWGNSAAGIENESETFSGGWGALKNSLDLNKDVYSYRTATEKARSLELNEKRKNGTITETELNELDDMEEHQVMFFCAYRPDYGPEPELSTDSIVIDASMVDPAFGDNIAGTYDPREVPFLGVNVNYFKIFNGNNNINITFENEGVDGPNFVLPSSQAGKDGYNPSANWMPARINKLTDNGWSYLSLVQDPGSGETEFKKVGGVDAWNRLPDNRIAGGPYNYYAYTFTRFYRATFMPLGDQYYMQFSNSLLNASSANNGYMYRISSNPLVYTDEEKTYIDFGVYEYQHRKLRINQSSDIDVLWVSETEDLEKGNDGYTWDAPTSNLQAAIETLMRSRNGHAKQINIIKGEYKPNAVLGSGDDMSLSFTIQSQLMNDGALTPQTGQDYGIKSLTIRGGYDPDIPDEAGFNPDKNPVVFSLARRTSITNSQLGHIVNILDAEQYVTTISQQGVSTSMGTGFAIPITIEGITFENTLSTVEAGGAAIYYHGQTKYDATLGAKGDTLLAPPAKQVFYNPADSTQSRWELSGEPKLTIRNCIFRNNGASAVSAVRIDGGAGSSLIVNSLFDHNTGDPLQSVNTTLLNCTFAQNQGYLKIKDTEETYGQYDNGSGVLEKLSIDYHSAMHNSVLWRENLAGSGLHHWSIQDKYGNELVMGASDSLTYNSYSLPDAEDNPTTADVEDAFNNLKISRVNSDVLFGPNFVNPDAGDYHLYPSKRVMNVGSNATYARLVWPEYYTEDYAGALVYESLMRNLHPDQSTYDTLTTIIHDEEMGIDRVITYLSLRKPKDYDLGSIARLQSVAIDRGAYECPGSGQRIIYVNPDRVTSTGNETGRTWEEAYGADKLQLAIDAASIYTNNSEDKKAYVFVQGSNVSQGNLIVREGVDVYGSLPRGYTNQAIPLDRDADEWDYAEAEIQSFINRVRAERLGMASDNNTQTLISGISTVNVLDHKKTTVIDGFLITNNATAESPATTPAVDIQVRNVSISNCMITGNVMADGIPVVNLEGRADGLALMYNTLVYGNTASTLVNVGNQSRVLNCTVVADNEGETPVGGYNDDTHVLNTIAVNESAGRYPQFAPYMRPNANTYYEPDGYLTEHRPYWYQLVETSNLINAGTDDGTSAQGANSIAQTFPWAVNFNLDRDILGNPRRLGGKIDDGCFETWRIYGNRRVTNLTNGKAYEDLLKYITDITAADYTLDGTESVEEREAKESLEQLYDSIISKGLAIDKAEYWNENYGGNHYPHTGSVVYVMKDANLIIDTLNADPLFAVTNPVRPGYVLVKTGGSIYGQSNAMQFAYVAVEKPFAEGAQYGLVSMPFDCNLDATYSLTVPSQPFEAYTYDATGRAAYNYEFQAENSSLWKIYDKSLQRGRYEGWLMKFNTALPANDTLRFTGWAAEGRYAYEDFAGELEKTVVLGQKDNIPNDGTGHFTRVEDMGWNLTGMPYLVSTYRTDDPVTQYDYNMHLPHILYKMNTEGEYVKNSTSYAVTSWTNEELLTMHEGFFLQTAAIAQTENLRYTLPVFSEAAPLAAPRPLVKFGNTEGQGDILKVYPDSEADKQVTYSMGRDGVKWLLNDVPQLYMVADKGSRLSLAAAAPTEIDLPLGIHVPDAAEGDVWEGSSLYTFSLPDPEAYEEYNYVWLIDRSLNRVTNLLENDYTVTLGPQTDNSRFRLRIGGYPLGTADGREYIVYLYDHTLYVRGLVEGDVITVYGANGALILDAVATSPEYSCPIPFGQGVFSVKVNDYGTKVINL